MKWVLDGTRRDCESLSLEQLLDDSLGEREAERLEKHLSQCPRCQNRLTDLAAQPNWWLDAGRLLDPIAGIFDPCSGDSFAEHSTEEDRFQQIESDLLEAGVLQRVEQTEYLGQLSRYLVRSVIGAGGTGVVLLADDGQLNRTVAIKVLAPALAVNGPARKRFAREAQAVAAVAHENVVTIHHVEAGGKIPFLVMQYIEGLSLQDLVIRQGPVDIKTALRMTAQIAAALSAAHDQSLVHRDVKPANILVGTSGQRVWITDFGLARAVDDASLTRTGFVAGTPHYMSPEQARGAVVGAGSDLFGLGSVMYFMLTGRPPFRAERSLAILNRICTQPHRPIREVNSDVPTPVSDVIDRLLAKSPADRFADADSLRRECMRLLASDNVSARSSNLDRPPVNRGRRWIYRSMMVAILLMLTGTWCLQHFAGASPSDPHTDELQASSANMLPEQETREAHSQGFVSLPNQPSQQAFAAQPQLVQSSIPIPAEPIASPGFSLPATYPASTPNAVAVPVLSEPGFAVGERVRQASGFAQQTETELRPESSIVLSSVANPMTGDDDWNLAFQAAQTELASYADLIDEPTLMDTFLGTGDQFDREVESLEAEIRLYDSGPAIHAPLAQPIYSY